MMAPYKKQAVKVVEVETTHDCPFITVAEEFVEIQGGDRGYVCKLIKLDRGGRARCNSTYPPRYCPLFTNKVLVAIKRG